MCPWCGTVFVSSQSLFHLSAYLRALSNSFGLYSACIQFDLHIFSFTKRNRYTPFAIHILDDRQGFEIRKTRKCKRKKSCGAKQTELETKRQKRHNVKFRISSGEDEHGYSVSTQQEHEYQHEDKEPCQRILSPTSQSVQQKGKKLMKGNICIGVIDDRRVHVDAESQNKDLNQVRWDKIGDQQAKVISQFEKLVSSGPDYVCSCCTQTFFGHCMRNVEKQPEAKKISASEFLTKYKSKGNIEWICQGCWDSARLGKSPKFWVHNGLKFTEKPKELEVSNLEERLVSPRLPFMQLQEMPRGGQVNLKGNIVNVPADVNGTIKSLPRMVDEN